MSDGLQRGAPIGVEWKPVEEERPVQTITVTPVMNVPRAHAHVSRNVATGQIMIDDITVNDLTDLRDSTFDQINEDREKRNGWEPF